MRRSLVIAEIGLTCMLLTGAGLLVLELRFDRLGPDLVLADLPQQHAAVAIRIRLARGDAVRFASRLDADRDRSGEPQLHPTESPTNVQGHGATP